MMEHIQLCSAAKKEKDFFNKLSQEWWNKENGPLKALHTLNKIRVPYVVECLKNIKKIDNSQFNSELPLAGLNVLDVGCGGGILCEALDKLGCNLTGIDPAVDLIQIAIEHAKLNENLKVTYINTMVENFCLKNIGKFDLVIASEVLEHIVNKEEFVKCCCMCLKPGGSIFLSAINHSWYSWFMTIILCERVYGVIPVGTHDWNKYITPENTIKILEANDCELKHSVGTHISPNYEWYKTNKMSTFYNLHAVKKT